MWLRSFSLWTEFPNKTTLQSIAKKLGENVSASIRQSGWGQVGQCSQTFWLIGLLFFLCKENTFLLKSFLHFSHKRLPLEIISLICPSLSPQKRDDTQFQGAGGMEPRAEGGGGDNEDLSPYCHWRTLNLLRPFSAFLRWPQCFYYFGRKSMRFLPRLPCRLVAMETPIPHTWFTHHAWLSPDRGHRLAFALCFPFMCLPGT